MRATIVRALALIAVTVAAAFTFAGQSRVASAGGGACHQAPAREGPGTEVRLTRNCFSPSILRVEAGANVTFHNDDEVLHQLSSVPGEQPGDSGLTPGQVATRTFMDSGIYPYFCHGMVGAVVVGDGKFIASSGNRAVAIQAAQPQSQQPPQAVQPGPAASVTSTDGDNTNTWPMMAGLGVAILWVVAGGAIAYRGRQA